MQNLESWGLTGLRCCAWVKNNMKAPWSLLIPHAKRYGPQDNVRLAGHGSELYYSVNILEDCCLIQIVVLWKSKFFAEHLAFDVSILMLFTLLSLSSTVPQPNKFAMNLLYLKAAVTAMLFSIVSAVPEPLHVRDFGPNIESMTLDPLCTLFTNWNISEYAVKSLPEISFPISPSWAGSLPIGGAYGTDSLFFWLWQAETKAPSNDLIIWFNGGPGCSSLVGLFKENGPIQFYGNSTCPEPNEYSYTKLANVLYSRSSHLNLLICAAHRWY